MPKYDFKCPICGVVTETETTESEQTCSQGHEEVSMKRVYSLSGILFKGSGFARNEKK